MNRWICREQTDDESGRTSHVALGSGAVERERSDAPTSEAAVEFPHVVDVEKCRIGFTATVVGELPVSVAYRHGELAVQGKSHPSPDRLECGHRFPHAARRAAIFCTGCRLRTFATDRNVVSYWSSISS